VIWVQTLVGLDWPMGAIQDAARRRSPVNVGASSDTGWRGGEKRSRSNRHACGRMLCCRRWWLARLEANLVADLLSAVAGEVVEVTIRGLGIGQRRPLAGSMARTRRCGDIAGAFQGTARASGSLNALSSIAQGRLESSAANRPATVSAGCQRVPL
jgi:hypothetical protein